MIKVRVTGDVVTVIEVPLEWQARFLVRIINMSAAHKAERLD